MRSPDINAFMDRFHQLERDLRLFESRSDGLLWWDPVRFESCYFLYDRLSGLTYSSASRPAMRGRRLGALRRAAERQWLFARARLDHRDLLVLRSPRAATAAGRHDVVLDPLIELAPTPARVIDTIPRRYHLPDCDHARWRGGLPPSLPELTRTLTAAFDLPAGDAATLEALIRRNSATHRCHVAGYERLFDRARPSGVLMVSVDKALFHVATTRGVPVAEAQHGLIGHGHPAYSYPADLDYRAQTTLPSLFLTFAPFWERITHYPARRQAVVGTDHFAAGFAPIIDPLGDVMVISADIYHSELFALTRALAALLPRRRFVYKLHPNQIAELPAIRAAAADLVNIQIGDPSTPASRMMAGVTHLVAIQSTVVYEALQHGRRVCLLPRHDYQIHADLFDMPTVTTSATPERIAADLARPAGDGSALLFFEPFDRARAAAAVAELVGGQAR